jgi:proline dehydrogenase
MLQTLRNRVVDRIASRHVAGPETDDALEVCFWAQDHDYGCILSPWADMESNGQQGKPRKLRMFERFKSDIDLLKSHELNAYLSIKLDALGYDFGLFRDLVDYAAEHKVHLHIDSLAPESTATKFRFLEKVPDYHNWLGCTLPSRWLRSLTDANRAIDMQLAVRIVKGQWQDPNQPIDERANYLALTNKLAGRVPYIGIATHDLPLARQALQRLSTVQLHFEFEQFFSLPLNGMGLADELSVPYRLYVAYGHPAIPYNYRFAMTRPSLAAWMVSDYVFELKRPWT